MGTWAVAQAGQKTEAAFVGEGKVEQEQIGMELLDRLGGRGRGVSHAGNGEVVDSVDVVGVDAGHLEVVVDDEGSDGCGHRVTATGRRGRVTRSTPPGPAAMVMSPPSRSAIWRTNARPR